MGYGNGNDNYSIVKGLAYTEDHVLVYNIFVYNIPKMTKEQQALDYFKKFGEVLKVRLVFDRKKSKIGFVNFADSKVAAKVLQNKNHYLNNRHVGIRACDSWHQPDAQTAETLHAAEQKSSAETEPGAETEQPSCSSSSSADLDALILKLNDDCLEHICKNLVMRDQINFGRTCQRFSGVFSMLSKVEYKILLLSKMRELTLWQIRQFLKMAGPHIESLVGEVPLKDRKRIFEYLGSYCTNAKCVYIDGTQLNPVFLRKLIGKMSLCTELSFADVGLGDGCIPILKSLPNLKILKLEQNCELTGKHISDLRGIEELSLKGSRCIQSFHFKQICKNLTNLNTLDITHCTHLKPADFKQISISLNNLENLKFSSISGPYECIAQLPKLKSLEISDVDRFCPIRHQLFVDLAKYQSEQLEELLLMSRNSFNLENASLVGELKKLKRLRCGKNETLDDNCLEKIAQLTELEEINLKNCNALTNKGVLNLLEHCHQLNRINIIGCKSLTDAFVFEALKLLKKQNVQMHRKGPVHISAYRTNIDKFVTENSELKSSSHLMKINFQFQINGDYDLSDDSEFGDYDDDDDDDDLDFAGAYIDSDDDLFMYYSDADEDSDLDMEVLHQAYNLFGRYHAYGDDVNDYLW